MGIQPIGNALTSSPALSSPMLSNQTAAPGSTRATAATVTASETGSPALQPDAQQPDPVQLAQAVSSVNQTMQKLAPELEFSIDQDSNRTIVKVVDKQTNKLIRQMPSAEMLEIAKAMDRVQGLLISLRA